MSAVPAIPPTEELTITLPRALAELVRAEATARGYASPVEYLSHAIRADISNGASDVEDWVRTVGVARYDAYDADPTDVFTAEEVRQAIADRLHPLTASR